MTLFADIAFGCTEQRHLVLRSSGDSITKMANTDCHFDQQIWSCHYYTLPNCTGYWFLVLVYRFWASQIKYLLYLDSTRIFNNWQRHQRCAIGGLPEVVAKAWRNASALDVTPHLLIIGGKIIINILKYSIMIFDNKHCLVALFP